MLANKELLGLACNLGITIACSVAEGRSDLESNAETEEIVERVSCPQTGFHSKDLLCQMGSFSEMV
jgi:hypothetical protein